MKNEEIEPVTISHSIYVKTELNVINEDTSEGYDRSRSHRFVLELLNHRHLDVLCREDNNFKSMEDALIFITEHREKLHYMDLTILPELNIPHIY